MSEGETASNGAPSEGHGGQMVLEPPYPAIAEALRTGTVIPFVGSGASPSVRGSEATWKKGMADCLPTPQDLANHLAMMARFPEQATRDLTTVAQYYDIVVGRGSLENELHAIFDVECTPCALHRFLARVEAPALIVTTNYDDLLEQAFDEAETAYDLVVHTTGQKPKLRVRRAGADEMQEATADKLLLDLENRAVIYKMHGTVARATDVRDEYVITEDDYIDFLGRMIGRQAIPNIFAEPFQTRHFLFLGYGLHDWNLRVVLSRIQREHRIRREEGLREPLKWWAIDAKPSPVEQRFWMQRGVEIFQQTIDAFVTEMEAYLAPPHPEPVPAS
jgi:SIR2-like domain